MQVIRHYQFSDWKAHSTQCPVEKSRVKVTRYAAPSRAWKLESVCYTQTQANSEAETAPSVSVAIGIHGIICRSRACSSDLVISISHRPTDRPTALPFHQPRGPSTSFHRHLALSISPQTYGHQTSSANSIHIPPLPRNTLGAHKGTPSGHLPML